MSKRALLLILPLLVSLAQPAPAFWGGAMSALKGDSGKTPKSAKGESDKEPSAWDKLVSDASKTFKSDKKDGKGKDKSDWDKLTEKADQDLKEGETDQGNKDNFSWDQLKDRADGAMKKFAEDGKGFDIMRKVKRKVEKLTSDEDSALTGRFYDLKQPLDKKAQPLYRGQVSQFIKNFMDSDWDREMLEQYYSPKVELAAPYFYLPRCKASYAPLAFNCNSGQQERTVEPHAWVVIYSGQVKAPESGYFRFVGMGDDTIVVRFNEEVVLEAGWSINSTGDMDMGTRKKYQDYISSPKGGCALYQYKETPHWNERLGGIPTGKPFKVEEGKYYPIEILISEIPGVEFGYCLLIEKLESAEAPTGKYKVGEAPTVAIFRTNETLPDLKEIEETLKRDGHDYAVGKPLQGPPFLEDDSPIWKVKPTGRRKRTIVERVVSTTVSDEDTAMGRRLEAEEPCENCTEDAMCDDCRKKLEEAEAEEEGAEDGEKGDGKFHHKKDKHKRSRK